MAKNKDNKKEKTTNPAGESQNLNNERNMSQGADKRGGQSSK